MQSLPKNASEEVVTKLVRNEVLRLVAICLNGRFVQSKGAKHKWKIMEKF